MWGISMKKALTPVFIIILLTCGMMGETTAAHKMLTPDNSNSSWWSSQTVQNKWLGTIACVIGAAGLFGLWYWRKLATSKKQSGQNQQVIPTTPLAPQSELDKGIYKTNKHSQCDNYTIWTINDHPDSEKPYFHMYKQLVDHNQDGLRIAPLNIFLEQENLTGIIKGLRWYSNANKPASPLGKVVLNLWKKNNRIKFPKEPIILDDNSTALPEEELNATVYLCPSDTGNASYTPRNLSKSGNRYAKRSFLGSTLAVGPDTPLVQVYFFPLQKGEPSPQCKTYTHQNRLLEALIERWQEFLLPYYLFHNKNEGDIIVFYVLSEDKKRIKVRLAIGKHRALNYTATLTATLNEIMQRVQEDQAKFTDRIG
jgi:hypothetical protein